MKTVLINLLSDAIGDTIASSPYASEFQKKNNCKVYFKINGRIIPFLRDVYTNISFVDKKTVVDFDEEIKLDYIFNKNVQGGFAEQLGFPNPLYIRPRIKIGDFLRTIKNKYIVLGVHSTGQIRYWNHPSGIKSQPSAPNWNDLSGRFRKLGYTPVTIERDELFGSPPFFNGVPSKSNKKIGIDLLESLKLISHCEFYVGLNSGMAWLAHALGKKVVMISNFSEDWNEFDLSLDDYIRITDKSVCHGCWNKIDIDHQFDPNDWYWCPIHKGTERQFECHKSITVDSVIEQIKIKNWI